MVSVHALLHPEHMLCYVKSSTRNAAAATALPIITSADCCHISLLLLLPLLLLLQLCHLASSTMLVL
jgi:hypothetical protein